MQQELSISFKLAWKLYKKLKPPLSWPLKIVAASFVFLFIFLTIQTGEEGLPACVLVLLAARALLSFLRIHRTITNLVARKQSRLMLEFVLPLALGRKLVIADTDQKREFKSEIMLATIMLLHLDFVITTFFGGFLWLVGTRINEASGVAAFLTFSFLIYLLLKAASPMTFWRVLYDNMHPDLATEAGIEAAMATES